MSMNNHFIKYYDIEVDIVILICDGKGFQSKTIHIHYLDQSLIDNPNPYSIETIK